MKRLVLYIQYVFYVAVPPCFPLTTTEQVMFPLMEHVLFRFILDGWAARYAIACTVMSFWIGAMKL